MHVLEEIFRPPDVALDTGAERLIITLLIAFILGQLNAWCYLWTHRGVSYSRSVTQALVLITIVAAISMSLVAARAMVAIGLLGGLALIRFRTTVRDARDTAYIFLCLTCGIAAGFGFYGAAIVGALVANGVACYLHFSRFGAWHSRESLLRFRVRASALSAGTFGTLFSRFCKHCEVVSVDELPVTDPASEPDCQCVYKIRLRDMEDGPDLVAELQSKFPTSAVQLLVSQEYEEVS